MDPVRLTKELVRIPSVNPFRFYEVDGRGIGVGCEEQINEHLETLLMRAGFAVKRQLVEAERMIDADGERIRIPARWNVLAEKGEGQHSLLLFGHTDTVDGRDSWGWDPLIGREFTEDGALRFSALGANDMKAGLAAITCAAADAAPNGWKLKLAFLVDEEFYSFGAVRLVESSFLDDVRLALAPEISDDNTPGDTQWIGIGRLGRSEFHFTVRGHACHGADAWTDPRAVNAVHEAIKLEHALLRVIAESKRTYEHSGISVMNSAFLNRHTGGRGILTVPDRAECVLDRSFVMGESSDTELASLIALLPALRERAGIDPRTEITLVPRPRPTPPCKPYFFEPAHPLIAPVLEASRNICGKVRPGIGRSVADENRIADRGIPTVTLGPTGRGSHTNSEWVDVGSILRVERIYREILARDWAHLFATAAMGSVAR